MLFRVVNLIGLPAALLAAILTYAVVERLIGLDAQWAAVSGAIAGGWVLGRLQRRPLPDHVLARLSHRGAPRRR